MWCLGPQGPATGVCVCALAITTVCCCDQASAQLTLEHTEASRSTLEADVRALRATLEALEATNVGVHASAMGLEEELAAARQDKSRLERELVSLRGQHAHAMDQVCLLGPVMPALFFTGSLVVVLWCCGEWG